ncbi:hypothetical protein [Clostridium sp. Marseille-P2415]|uniref:hypothetical protein n=1 Tax=Clostridium sp. Marseille-P2415 TaxID=1805471 RepID=UPI00098845CA|nr:hypothetical protein [Clostridium sp. Marseille-P2415]
MSNYTYEQIKKTVLEWSQNDISKELARDDLIEITKNEDEVLLIDLTFDYCLAQIVVSKPIFAPYQYVSFEAMTLESKKAQETGKPEMVYFFYDSAEMLENKVLDELSFGVKLCSEYLPDQLSQIYLNKNGLLTIINEDLCHVMHPDDIKKYDEKLLAGNFVCTDIESQYLVVKSNLITLRVLPQVFNIK